mgnify:CR=1 FL=1
MKNILATILLVGALQVGAFLGYVGYEHLSEDLSEDLELRTIELRTIVISLEEEARWVKDTETWWWPCDKFKALDPASVTLDDYAENRIAVVRCY